MLLGIQDKACDASGTANLQGAVSVEKISKTLWDRLQGYLRTCLSSHYIQDFLSVPVNKKMHVHGMYAKNAFLNSTLEYKVYMEQPKGLVNSDTPHYVCKL